ncbi:MAG: PTS sugar transporter subunit IIB [Bifidobacterium tibiigranuli]|uniref:PTS sugar transporter subunit IIB n=1 Tax=Bifidobacterium tibiigranuli TaxID=2172043 RepID=UPI0023538F81|nr:PTS sugar transporter subunit IIB [Bifidobacterium tibiigranuli]MCH3975213.1 PTS sugar transporter subunit IIB [Bifidobacterium tibiigranuli]MCH4190639.1 PTS sugar transporter subunit IIB [Bifidobacterium tibiigranuli]MCH4203411.1 PTS sugar transporter subunit IIB [Bifidobacterium tibiigranuli]MCH4273977.1 PTS sugar transporter subunit IIB [Bifidobacterium tibiigranuli]
MKILTACSTGLGSSFMTQLNIDKALKELGVDGIETDHTDLSSVTPASADVVFVGRDIAEAAEGKNGDIVVLNSLIDMNEIKQKVAAALERHGVAVPNE